MVDNHRTLVKWISLPNTDPGQPSLLGGRKTLTIWCEYHCIIILMVDLDNHQTLIKWISLSNLIPGQAMDERKALIMIGYQYTIKLYWTVVSYLKVLPISFATGNAGIRMSMPRMMSGLELGQCVTSGWWVAWSYWVQCETRGESVCVVCQCKTVVHWSIGGVNQVESVCVCGMQQEQGSIWSVVVSQWWPVWLVKVVPPSTGSFNLPTNISRVDKLTLTPVRGKERHVWSSLVFPFLDLFRPSILHTS